MMSLGKSSPRYDNLTFPVNTCQSLSILLIAFFLSPVCSFSPLQAQLEMIMSTNGLSENVFEIASKSLSA